MKSRTLCLLVAAACLTGTSLLAAEGPTPLITRGQTELLRVLESGASRKEKADACRELSVEGTRDSVPVLLKLLGDAELSHMARYALESLRDASVDTALREALPALQGRPLVGAIGSIGVRRDAKAVPALAKYLTHADADAAQAAARALGSIGSRDAAKALEEVLASVSAANRLAVHEGLFRCAESFSDSGLRKDARDLYDRLRALESADAHVRAGALRGAVLTRSPGEAVELIREALNASDYVLTAAAALSAQELAGPEVTRVLVAEIGQLPADRQILVLQTLARRGDPDALPAVTGLTRNAPPPVRLAAVQTVGEIGAPSAVALLIPLMTDSDTAVARAAEESLAALSGAEVDRTILAMVNSTDAGQRTTGMELVGRRRMFSALPALRSASGDPDAKIRVVAIRRLGELGGEEDFTLLLGLLTSNAQPGDQSGIEQALSAIVGRLPNPSAILTRITSVLAKAQPGAKAVLLRVLGVAGGAEALSAVRGAVGDPDSEVRTAAIRTLGTWKTADAAPSLLELAKSTTDPRDKILCLRGYLGWARSTELALERRVAMCRDVVPLVQTDDEKKLLLGTVGTIRSSDVLAMAVPHLGNPGTREEAAVAIVSVADSLFKGPTDATASAAIRDALQKASEAVGDSPLAGRIRKNLEEAKNRTK